jgi:hypothetical protein
MLKKNSDRFERDVLHPELGEKLRAEDTRVENSRVRNVDG